jgi:hypothetical protein
MALVIERKIQEYILEEGLNEINMPKDAYLCDVGLNENDSMVLWAEVKTPTRMKIRKFRVIRSKWPIAGPTKKMRYVGTFNNVDKTPWHVYEEVK